VPEDSDDLISRVDTPELFRHGGCARAIVGILQHGADRFAQRLGRWTIGREINANPGPGDARVHVRFVFGQPGSDERNAKAQGLIDAAVTPVGHKHIDVGEQPFERQVGCEACIDGD
jgi:hypothetical protein